MEVKKENQHNNASSTSFSPNEKYLNVKFVIKYISLIP